MNPRQLGFTETRTIIERRNRIPEKLLEASMWSPTIHAHLNAFVHGDMPYEEMLTDLTIHLAKEAKMYFDKTVDLMYRMPAGI